MGGALNTRKTVGGSLMFERIIPQNYLSVKDTFRTYQSCSDILCHKGVNRTKTIRSVITY